MSVRLDKWLQVARVFKTRSQATRACNLNRVRVNGQVAKPRRLLQLEDSVVAKLGDWKRVLIVKELADRPLPKKEAARVFEDQSPPRPKRDAWQSLARRPAAQRERGLGRPTKRDRRIQERFLDAESPTRSIADNAPEPDDEDDSDIEWFTSENQAEWNEESD